MTTAQTGRLADWQTGKHAKLALTLRAAGLFPEICCAVGCVQGVGVQEMKAGAQPVIGVSDKMDKPGSYILELRAPRTRTTATIHVEMQDRHGLVFVDEFPLSFHMHFHKVGGPAPCLFALCPSVLPHALPQGGPATSASPACLLSVSLPAGRRAYLPASHPVPPNRLPGRLPACMHHESAGVVSG